MANPEDNLFSEDSKLTLQKLAVIGGLLVDLLDKLVDLLDKQDDIIDKLNDIKEALSKDKKKGR